MFRYFCKSENHSCECGEKSMDSIALILIVLHECRPPPRESRKWSRGERSGHTVRCRVRRYYFVQNPQLKNTNKSYKILLQTPG